ncbi:molybdenum cofactor guanylyltransferase [Ferruginibacter sp. SUN106]|uniref:molybdenum cofactor guanylyltransferase n=1 Tax=Ferruginibacter sp. SUN106 TaxID=2978348 RepID=UPI003D35F211
MLGIVLCGGQSSRMGSDKGLLLHEAKTWAQTAVEKLSVLQIPMALSINEQQLHEYAKVFPPESLIVDDNALDIKGPLLGLLSVHTKNPTKDIFLLACDLPLMDPNLLKELFSLHQQSKKYDVYIFTNDKQAEPLCGIYTAKALKKIITLQKQNKLIRHSMKFILSQLIVCEIAAHESQKICFRNFNAHADINGL